MKVIIDNGHGVNTLANSSPDGRLIEGVYAREIARLLCEGLAANGVDAVLLTPQDEDVPLGVRTRLANSIHRQNRGNTILISLHSDATPGKGWSEAKGMSVRLSQNASQRSKTLARCLYAAFEKERLPVRKWNGDVVPWWPQNLAICRDTVMPAVLVEMFFHTNKEQVEWALSKCGKNAILSAITEAIMNFIA